MNPKQIAKKIINALEDRKGFDAWYDDLDREIKKEIIDEISKIIKEG